jgi:hypothetical protein
MGSSERRPHTHEVEAVGGEIRGVDVLGQIVTCDGEAPTVGGKRIFNDRRLSDHLPLGAGESESAVMTG